MSMRNVLAVTCVSRWCNKVYGFFVGNALEGDIPHKNSFAISALIALSIYQRYGKSLIMLIDREKSNKFYWMQSFWSKRICYGMYMNTSVNILLPVYEMCPCSLHCIIFTCHTRSLPIFYITVDNKTTTLPNDPAVAFHCLLLSLCICWLLLLYIFIVIHLFWFLPTYGRSSRLWMIGEYIPSSDYHHQITIMDNWPMIGWVRDTMQ